MGRRWYLYLLPFTWYGRARVADQDIDGAHLGLDGLEGGGELRERGRS